MPKPTTAQLATYADENEALAVFKRAQADLADYTAKRARAGTSGETAEYHRLNDAVIAAGKRLPERFRYLTKQA